MVSLESGAAPAILAFFERPAAQHAKVVNRPSLHDRVGFGLRSLAGRPTPLYEAAFLSPLLLLVQLPDLPSSASFGELGWP